ncbi:MAG: IS110 family transposase [Planctomycetia bacterium]|nr:IS110 family transposase [Planctomycetia bacterium]
MGHVLRGVSFIVGFGILLAVGNVRRFEDGAHVAAYLGLVPSTHQSANHCYTVISPKSEIVRLVV